MSKSTTNAPPPIPPALLAAATGAISDVIIPGYDAEMCAIAALEAAQVAAMIETLQGIANAKPHEWDEGFNTLEDFYRWAQNRARHTLHLVLGEEGDKQNG